MPGARNDLTIVFPEQIVSVDTSAISSTSSVTTSGQDITTTANDGQSYSISCTLVEGYKIANASLDDEMSGSHANITDFTDNTIQITAGSGGIGGTLTITTAQSTVKAVSNKNLTKFKQNCDNTYAKIGNIPTVSTELVNLGTLSTSGTLTEDQATQIGTTTVGVTARASVNSVTRFYERVNISGTTAMLISADDDALHVLTVNLSTRAYTLSDVALGGGGIEDNAVIENSLQELPSATADSADFVQYPAGTLNFKAKNFQGNASGYTRLATYNEIPNVPAIPTPTTADNGKVLGVANGAYSLLNLFPVGAYYITESTTTPASLFGGEWVQVSGKFLLGQSVQDGYLVGSEGGEKTHTLTTEEMPQHSHKPHQYTWILSHGTNTGQNVISGGSKGNANIFNVDDDQNRYTGTAGGNQPHNNMPPYRSVFIWRRIA